MRITAGDGSTVTLQPRGWEFPRSHGGASGGRWLVIDEQVDLGDRTWSFSDPCLLIREAQRLARWLRRAAAGKLRPRPLPDPASEDCAPSLGFVEPVLGFSLGVRGESDLLVRCHFSLEAAPPWLSDPDKRPPKGYVVDLAVSPAELRRAADEWAQELDELLGLLPSSSGHEDDKLKFGKLDGNDPRRHRQ